MSSRARCDSSCINTFLNMPAFWGPAKGGGAEQRSCGVPFRTIGVPGRTKCGWGNAWDTDLRTVPLATFSQRIQRLLERDHPAVGDRGRTIVHLHGERRPRAIVLLHGLSSSPSQFERFARDLFERGHNVLVPRLPHHGHADRFSTALARLRPDELYAATSEYVGIASELGERVTIAGFSLGGLLTAWCAQHYEVDRCVAIAPFFGVAWIPGGLMTWVAEAMLHIPNRFHWW